MGAAQLSVSGSITDLSSEWIDPKSNHNYTYQDRDEVPLMSGIMVSVPDGSGNVSITGAPGAIPPMAAKTSKDWLRVASIDGGLTCVRYGSDGSFCTQLAGCGPGHDHNVGGHQPGFLPRLTD